MFVSLEHLAAEFAKLVAIHLAGPVVYVDLRTLEPNLRRKAYEACRDGSLPATKKGKRWYATEEALATWMGVNDPETTLEERAKTWLMG